MAAPGQQRRLSRWETARQNHANAPYPEPRTKLRERPRGGFASLGPSLASSRGGAELGAPAAALARFRAPPAPGAGGGPSRARPAAIQEAERGPGAAAAPRPAPRRAGLCPAALPVRAGGGAAREAPPRPRRRAARRARLATPSRAGPGARAYSSPPPPAHRQQSRPAAAPCPANPGLTRWLLVLAMGPARPARPALRSPFKIPAHGGRARANGAPASSACDVTHNNPPPPLRRGQDFRAVRSLTGGAACYSRARARGAPPRQPPRPQPR